MLLTILMNIYKSCSNYDLDQGCSNVFNSGPNFTFAYIYWATTKKATSGSACCETGTYYVLCVCQ